MPVRLRPRRLPDKAPGLGGPPSNRDHLPPGRGNLNASFLQHFPGDLHRLLPVHFQPGHIGLKSRQQGPDRQTGNPAQQQPGAQGRDQDRNAPNRRSFRFDLGRPGRRGTPGPVQLVGRQGAPFPGPPSDPPNGPQGNQGEQHHQDLIDPDAGRRGYEQRDGKPDHVKGEVEDDSRQQSIPQVDGAEEKGGQDQLHHPGVGGLGGIGRVAGAENQRLQHHGRSDPECGLSETAPQQRRAGQGDGAKQALLPEAGLKRDGYGGKPGQIGCQDVRLQQGVGGGPPTQHVVGKEVESHLIAEEKRHQQICRHRISQDRPRIDHSPRSQFPELNVVGKSLPRERLGGHEGEGQQNAQGHELDQGPRHLAGQESVPRQGRVVVHPGQRQLVEGHQALQKGDQQTPEKRLFPQHPTPAQEKKQPYETPAQDIDHHHGHASNGPDGGVGRAHFLIAPVEGLGHLDKALDLGEPVPAYRQTQPVASFPDILAPVLVDQPVIGSPSGLHLLGVLYQLIRLQLDSQDLLQPGLGQVSSLLA